MIREIVVYPDKRLKQKSKEVIDFDSKLHQLLDDMNETMLAGNGIGLAAIQIGVPLRVLLLNIPDDEGNQYPQNLVEVINPVILNKRGSTIYYEGCLSIPDYYDDVERAEWIQVEFYDRHGKRQELEADGLFAIAFQHEVDHLDGYLFVERLSFLKRKRFEKEWKKKQKELKKKDKR